MIAGNWAANTAGQQRTLSNKYGDLGDCLFISTITAQQGGVLPGSYIKITLKNYFLFE
jgi:hypothetical protein